jgi:hypothetical protein
MFLKISIVPTQATLYTRLRMRESIQYQKCKVYCSHYYALPHKAQISKRKLALLAEFPKDCASNGMSSANTSLTSSMPKYFSQHVKPGFYCKWLPSDLSKIPLTKIIVTLRSTESISIRVSFYLKLDLEKETRDGKLYKT